MRHYNYRIKHRFFVFLIMASLVTSIASAKEEWRELSGEHFLVYFKQDEKFAKEVLEKTEVYYRDIATDLGYPRYSEFWTWDKRVKIYIHPEHASFLKTTGQPEWSQGMADFKKKQIVSYAWSKGFLESLLPHEVAHLIFRDFVGFTGEIPLWLDEGVAQWEEADKRKEIKTMTQKLFNDGALLSINDMMKLDLTQLKSNTVYMRSTHTKDGKPGVIFLSLNNLVRTYYLQAASLVGFLIEKYGSDNFADFCRQLRDGKALEEALSFVYPTYMRSLSDLEEKWREYLKK